MPRTFDNISKLDFLFDCLGKIQLPMQLLYYVTDLVSYTGMYTDLEKQDYRIKTPEANVIKDLLDTLEKKGYKLTTDSMIYGDYYEEIFTHEQKLADVLPQNLLTGSNWMTKSWAPDTAYETSSHDCSCLETSEDNDDFNQFMNVLQDIGIEAQFD